MIFHLMGWLCKTNYNSVTVTVATPDMFDPVATNVVAPTREELQTILHSKPKESREKH